jgi:[glutamine synthetase] adenylyltransferase / [glutamine synthetase]-adenylyl-L-tyrosine phosphorylase
MDATQPMAIDSLPAAVRDRARRLQDDFLALRSDPPATMPGAGMVFLCSDYVTQIAGRHPEYVLDALDADGVMPARSDEEIRAWLAERLRAVADDAQLKACLRELRHRELIRVAWRDLLGQAGLDEVMHDLTRLADTLVQGAMEWLEERLQQRYGIPRDDEGQAQSLVVLGMGKPTVIRTSAGELRPSSRSRSSSSSARPVSSLTLIPVSRVKSSSRGLIRFS